MTISQTSHERISNDNPPSTPFDMVMPAMAEQAKFSLNNKNFYLHRPVDISNPLNENVVDLNNFLANIKSQNPHFVKYVKNIGCMGVTLFSSATLDRALSSSELREFKDYGRDIDKTVRVIESLKTSYDRNFIANVVAEPIRSTTSKGVAVDSNWRPDSNNRTIEGPLGTCHNDTNCDKKWKVASVEINRDISTLDGSDKKYVVIDVSRNSFIFDEIKEIREFFKSEHGISLNHYENPPKIHITFLKVPRSEAKKYSKKNQPLVGAKIKPPKNLTLLPPIFESISNAKGRGKG